MSKRYDSIDLFKFILSLMVVAIHFDPFGVESLRAPLLLLPVPLFFIISSFLFFRNSTEDTCKLRKFIKRNLLLYGAYFVLFFPYYILVWKNSLFSNGIISGVAELFTKFLLGSTFRSSWYIIALVIGVTIVFYLHQKKLDWLSWVLGISFYVISLFLTCYGNVPILGEMFRNTMDFYPGTFYQSFPISIIWISIGKSLAKHENACLELSKRRKIGMLLVSAVLLVAEYLIVRILNWEFTPAYCIMMIPVCISIFVLVLNLHLAKASALREASTVIYCAHSTIGDIIKIVASKMTIAFATFPMTLVLYIAVVLCCLLFLFSINMLKKYNSFKWCRYFI